MLTIKQPPSPGYRSFHDLPTPPSTAQPSPPFHHHDPNPHSLRGLPQSNSAIHPTSMSAPHRNLPPPSGMAHAHSASAAPPPPLPPTGPPHAHQQHPASAAPPHQQPHGHMP